MDGRGGRSEEDGGLEGGGEGREREREPRARKTSEQFKLPFQVVTLFMRTKIIRWAGGGGGERGYVYAYSISVYHALLLPLSPGWVACSNTAGLHHFSPDPPPVIVNE